MKKYLYLLIFVFLSISVTAQTDPYSEDVKVCLVQNGTHKYYADVVDQMFEMLKKQYSDKNVPSDIWTELEGMKPEAMTELSQMLVSAYRGHYSHEDVKNMKALYDTDAGKTMINNAEALTKKESKELAKFYESPTGQKLLDSQESMNRIMSKISEMWSSDLYRKTVANLADKGFKLEQ